jgi:hypothetical protein
MRTITELNFGYNDAFIFQSQEDSALQQKLFLADKHLDDLCERNKYFLVGDKGTGKTAYAGYVSNWGHRQIAGRFLFVQVADFEGFIRTANLLKLSPDQYRMLWKVILLIIHLRATELSGSLHGRARKTPARLVLKTLGDISLGAFEPSVNGCLSILEHVGAFAHRLVANSKSADKNLDIGGSSPYLLLQYIQRQILDGLAEFTLEKDLVLFVDGLDVRPPNVEYGDYINCVRGLISAGWELNTAQLQEIPDRRYRVVLLVRPDVLDTAGLQNLNNRLQDNSVIFNWYTPFQIYRNSALFHLADNLLRGQQEKPSSHKVGECWDHYFPNQEWRRDENDPVPFIEFLRSSFHRPRDIVTLLRLLRDEHLVEGMGSTIKFQRPLFVRHSLKVKFSDYLVGEIRNALEFFNRSPDYELVYRFFDESLRPHIRKRFEFTYKGFVDSYDHLRDYMHRNNIEAPPILSTADLFLQFLYELNMICFTEEDIRRPGKPIFRWSYREKNMNNLRPKVKTNMTYAIHFGIGMNILQPAPGTYRHAV